MDGGKCCSNPKQLVEQEVCINWTSAHPIIWTANLREEIGHIQLWLDSIWNVLCDYKTASEPVCTTRMLHNKQCLFARTIAAAVEQNGWMTGSGWKPLPVWALMSCCRSIRSLSLLVWLGLCFLPYWESDGRHTYHQRDNINTTIIHTHACTHTHTDRKPFGSSLGKLVVIGQYKVMAPSATTNTTQFHITPTQWLQPLRNKSSWRRNTYWTLIGWQVLNCTSGHLECSSRKSVHKV